jgi:hypothetical protein
VLALSTLLVSCQADEVNIDKQSCAIEATVRDLTGLDGCGFVFELSDGTRLEPVRILYCGTPPLPKEVTEDPLFNFQPVDGKRVRIGYEITEFASVCMAGKQVKINCIEEIGTDEK